MSRNEMATEAVIEHFRNGYLEYMNRMLTMAIAERVLGENAFQEVAQILCKKYKEQLRQDIPPQIANMARDLDIDIGEAFNRISDFVQSLTDSLTN